MKNSKIAAILFLMALSAPMTSCAYQMAPYEPDDDWRTYITTAGGSRTPAEARASEIYRGLSRHERIRLHEELERAQGEWLSRHNLVCGGCGSGSSWPVELEVWPEIRRWRNLDGQQKESVPELIWIDLKALRSSMDEREASSNLIRLSCMMAMSGYLSTVKFKTSLDGARVKYRLIAGNDEKVVDRLTNCNEGHEMPIGIYNIWTERNGIPTSSQTLQFDIVRSDHTIDLEEHATSDRERNDSEVDT